MREVIGWENMIDRHNELQATFQITTQILRDLHHHRHSSLKSQPLGKGNVPTGILRKYLLPPKPNPFNPTTASYRRHQARANILYFYLLPVNPHDPKHPLQSSERIVPYVRPITRTRISRPSKLQTIHWDNPRDNQPLRASLRHSAALGSDLASKGEWSALHP